MTQDAAERFCRVLGDKVADGLGADAGFALVVFQMGVDDAPLAWFSNANPPDVARVLRELATRIDARKAGLVMTPHPSDDGREVRRIREACKLTIEGLAEALGVAVSLVASWEDAAGTLSMAEWRALRELERERLGQ